MIRMSYVPAGPFSVGVCDIQYFNRSRDQNSDAGVSPQSVLSLYIYLFASAPTHIDRALTPLPSTHMARLPACKNFARSNAHSCHRYCSQLPWRILTPCVTRVLHSTWSAGSSTRPMLRLRSIRSTTSRAGCLLGPMLEVQTLNS